MIPYGKQSINQSDIDAVVEVLNSDFLTQGPMVPQFEGMVRKATGSEFAVAVNSATSALHIACLALGVTQGDLVWTTPISFVATANCALFCGANVDFVDIDIETYNLCPRKLKEKLDFCRSHGVQLPKCVIVVHLAGQSCEMIEIHKLSLEYGFKIIEDASHAIGGRYQGLPVGRCDYSDITVFSFHPVKIVTTAEGGIATTNNAELARRMELFRSHGVTRDQDFMSEDSHGGWYYQQIDLGYNYRMTELQAALGCSQMARLEDFVNTRNSIANEYYDLLEGLPLRLPRIADGVFSSWHLYIVCLKLDELKQSKKEVFDLLRSFGVGVNLHYIPIHTQPYYRKLKKEYFGLQNSEAYYDQAISIPLFHGMTQDDQRRVVKALEKSLV